MMTIVWFLAAVGALAIIAAVVLVAWWAWTPRSLPVPKMAVDNVVHIDAARWRQLGGRDDVRN